MTQELPENWYRDYSHVKLAIIGAEGTAANLEHAVGRYEREGKIKLDLSPKIPQGNYDMWVGNIYEPENVCTLQACQNNDGTENPYTTIVCTGIKESAIKAVLEFSAICRFEAGKPSEGFIASLCDQMLFRELYDDMYGRFKLREIMSKEKAHEFSLEILAESLKRQQKNYEQPGFPPISSN
ncbi:hypothetical protein KY317_00275 [Candidatus Woesearchaeota archaeon]|nr:hypothetical protein [Candidatus Woesearchaeota archaeon]